ncbi:MAG: histidine phosphatase family protein [Chitinispirillaceae bacterium]
MITILFIRHGLCDFVGKFIAGRKEKVHLNGEGRKQVLDLACRLETIPVSAIYSGPLERVVETAEIIARSKDVPVTVARELDEVDSGNWTGLSFEEVAKDPLWDVYNRFKGGTRIPGGEMTLEVASRVSGFVERVRRKRDGATVIMVSHGNPIKTVLAHYCGIPLDFISRFEVDPASVSVLRVDDYGAAVGCINSTGMLSL